MKITILMENAAGREDVCAEHGLSVYIETKKHRILMDTGASEKTVQNAAVLGVDLSLADTAVISHGHYDHAGGLLPFAELNPAARIFIRDGAFGDFYHGEKYIGIDKSIGKLVNLHTVTSDEYTLDGELSLFSRLTGGHPVPDGNRELIKRLGDMSVPDSFSHEMCLNVHTENKNVLFSGCAHSGILNILDRFSEIYGTFPDAVVSGFHMMKNSEFSNRDTENIRRTAKELAALPAVFYTGHCTGDAAFEIMKDIMGEKLFRIRAGDTFEL